MRVHGEQRERGLSKEGRRVPVVHCTSLGTETRLSHILSALSLGTYAFRSEIRNFQPFPSSFFCTLISNGEKIERLEEVYGCHRDAVGRGEEKEEEKAASAFEGARTDWAGGVGSSSVPHT